MGARREIGPGTVLGPYVLGELLGSGASAVVHAARDESGRELAVKVRRRGEESMDRRFLREFESLRQLRIPGVVQVHDAGFDDHVLWFAMERIRGQPLLARRFGRLGPEARIRAVLEAGRQLTGILASLHEAGFVHRDIKPTNVLLDESDKVHLLDFGISRYFGDQETLSHTGQILGTVPYMSPEQLSGLPVDEKVDLFAVGLILHEVLAGPRPRPGSTLEWIPRICLDRLEPLALKHPEVPLSLSALVEALLAADPADRPTAREASEQLGRILGGERTQAWPEPPFVDPGPWWTALQACIGVTRGPPVWILEGPSGSGRGRLAEQLHRKALVQGTWTLQVRCRVERVGGPILDLLERATSALGEDDAATWLGPAGDLLRRLWPQVPWPVQTGAASPTPEPPEAALAGLVLSLAERRTLLLVVHDLEQVDPLTAAWLRQLAPVAGPQLGLLLILESRWASPASRALVEDLRAGAAAGHLTCPPFEPAVAERIAGRICPPAGPEAATFDRPVTPLAAVLEGWRRLGVARGEAFPQPESGLWVLTLFDQPLPMEVFHSLAAAETWVSPWIRADEDRVRLDGPTAHTVARAGLTHLQRSAALLAQALQNVASDLPESAPPLATLWLVAGEQGRARIPVARSAALASSRELWASAQGWLSLLDTLPPSRSAAPDEVFEVALVRTRVALHLGSESVQRTELGALGSLARREDQVQRVRFLSAEAELRLGQPRAALVEALRLGSGGIGAEGPEQAPALLLAVRCWIALRQIPDALRDLERVEAALAGQPDSALHVRATNLRAELSLLGEDLLWCRALCQKSLRAAERLGDVRSRAEAASRLSLVLRRLGRRREAEPHARTAREVAARTGDAVLGAETELALATLLVERGEAAWARNLLDRTIRRVRNLSQDRLMPVALRLALQVATVSADVADGTLVLDQLAALPVSDPETPAAMVHWWRTRGDPERALRIPGPTAEQGRDFGTVRWRLERARAALAVSRLSLAETEARVALDQATHRGFAELQAGAQLLLGVLTEVDDASWADLQLRASSSLWTEVFLGALEMDARRLHRRDPAAARERWRTLLARSRELGYRPGVEESTGWLPDGRA